ncbi:MAG TPA: hypothetical protein VMS99_03080, partial [Acidimicrobiia bacterium]|nr:hypothetical protein [Acidimicrobiia bacterium]
MTAPGHSELGRSVVVGPGAPTPTAWTGADRIRIDMVLLSDPPRLAAVVADLQRRYVRRTPTVYEMEVEPGELTTRETTEAAPHELGGRFTFLRERLIKAVWHNSYDARAHPPIWWWGHKAAS